PVVGKSPLDAAADGPAPAGGRAAIGRGERSGRNADARPVDHRGRGVADPRNGGAAGGIEQGPVDSEAETPAERRHPFDPAEIDSHRLGDRNGEDGRAERARGAGAGPTYSTA